LFVFVVVRSSFTRSSTHVDSSSMGQRQTIVQRHRHLSEAASRGVHEGEVNAAALQCWNAIGEVTAADRKRLEISACCCVRSCAPYACLSLFVAVSPAGRHCPNFGDCFSDIMPELRRLLQCSLANSRRLVKGPQTTGT
jgi:hypothetical protein